MPDLTKPPWNEIVSWLRTDGFHILLVLIVAFLAQRLGRVAFHGIVKALLDREAAEGTAQELSAIEVHKRIGTLDELGSNVIRFLVFVIAALMILRELGLDIGPAIAGLGVVGIAVGFGAQSLVRDYLNGALILVENQYSKGDVVSIAGVTGTVEDFSLRRTTLRDLDGVVHTVPNGEVKVASNRTRTWARINQTGSAAKWQTIRSGSGGSLNRRGSSGSSRSTRWGSPSRSSAPSGPRSNGPPPANSASGCSLRLPPTGSRSPDLIASCSPVRAGRRSFRRMARRTKIYPVATTASSGESPRQLGPTSADRLRYEVRVELAAPDTTRRMQA